MKPKWLIFLIALGLMAGTAATLGRMKASQKLGQPGVKATPIPGQVQMHIGLPETVLDYTSTNVPEPDVVTDYLPKDTSYAERMYRGPGDFWATGTIVLMGADRTSIHRPDYCLPGQGWTIDSKTTVPLSIGGDHPYQMPVMKWLIHNTVTGADGQKQQVSGLYVFWFVADHEQTVDNFQRMWWLTRDLVRHGVLQRWAYISYFTVCPPGQEDATFDHLKKLIAASVPSYQWPPEARR